MPAIALEDVIDPPLWRRLRRDVLIQSLSARIWDWNGIVAISDLASLELAWQLYARDWNAYEFGRLDVRIIDAERV